MYVRVCKRDASQLYAFFHCNLLSRDGKAKRERARKIGVASPFSFWRKAQSGAVRKERRAREKRNRWTKSSRLLISNVSDYVGLGSLRFFIQTKEKRVGGGWKRGAGEADGLARYHVIVQFVVRHRLFRSPLGLSNVLLAFLVVPFSASRPCSFFIILYYFVFYGLRRAGWRDDDFDLPYLRGTDSRLRSISWGSECSWSRRTVNFCREAKCASLIEPFAW